MSQKLPTMVANSIVPRMLSSVGVGEPIYTGMIHDGRFARDKLAQIGHLLLTALIKARELNTAALEPELRQRVEELVKTTNGPMEKIEAVAEPTANNGQLCSATVDP